jgi:L-aminopeptidase/D-esterase-like protein
VVATDAVLTKAQAGRLASLAHNGIARCVNPLTMGDGDTLFAMATGTSGQPVSLTVLGALAAEAVTRAVLSAVHHASGITGIPAARDLAPPV